MAATQTKVKNVSGGPRFFNTAEGGLVTLDDGQEWEGELGEGMMKSFQRRAQNGVAEFEINGKALTKKGAVAEPGAARDTFDMQTDQEIRDFIKDRDGKAAPNNSTRVQLLELARKTP